MTDVTASREGGEKPGHTPGPWTAEPGGKRGAWVKGATGEWAALACGDTDASAEANARLIAAAPALLEALRAFAAFDTPETWRGTSWEHDEVGAVLHSYNTGVEVTREHFAAARAAIRLAETGARS